jgi:8-oxo-dGTP diphosphatase
LEFNFCPICAKPLLKPHDSFPYCPDGHYTQYPSVSTGVAAIVLKNGEVLLERRAIEPGLGRWGLPGGMMEHCEQPEETCSREIFEETGYKIAIKRFVTARSVKTVCALVFEAEVCGGNLVKSDESLDVQWFPIDNIPWQDMAFASHISVLKKWIHEQNAIIKDKRDE